MKNTFLSLFIVFTFFGTYAQKTAYELKINSRIKIDSNSSISVKYDFGASTQNLIASAFQEALFENGFSITSYPSDGSTNVSVKEAISFFRKEYGLSKDKKLYIFAFEDDARSDGDWFFNSLFGRLIDVSNNNIVATIRFKNDGKDYRIPKIYFVEACNLIITKFYEQTKP